MVKLEAKARDVSNEKKRRREGVTDTDSVAVVGDLDEFEAAILDEEADGGGGGVEAVLHELLHGGDGALDDLAGGDSVHHRLAQPLNFRGLHSPLILALFHSDRFNVLNAKGSNSSLNAFIHNFSIRLASPVRGLNLSSAPRFYTKFKFNNV